MRIFRRLAFCAAALLVAASVSAADATLELPSHSGSVFGVFATSGNAGPFIYVMTQWGMTRVSVANPAQPANPQLAQVGLKNAGGINNGGVVRMSCDCWQGPSTIDTAEAPDGSSRTVMDWLGGDQSLRAEVTTGTPSNVAFGQQINAQSVPLGSRVAAIYLPSGKYVGYLPYSSSGSTGGVAMVDLTSPTGNPAKTAGMPTTPVLPWGAGGVLTLRAAYVGGKYLLVAGANNKKEIRIAEIDPLTGIPTETSSVASAIGQVTSIAIASLDGRTFVFTTENAAGLRIYEYADGVLLPPITLPGNYSEVVLRGGTLPILFLHAIVSIAGRETYIEAWDTNWITRSGGNPAFARRGARVRHIGAPENFVGRFEARLAGNTAYLYRISMDRGAAEQLLETTSVDLTSLTVDPTQPPIAGSSAVNTSALLRQGLERAINYYGDRWNIQDASASSPNPPANGIAAISWDWNYAATFAADIGWSNVPYAGNSVISPAYFPCDPAVGGNIETGAGCWASLGNPTGSGSYRYAVQTTNGVGPSAAAPSVATTVAAPQASIAGLDTSVTPPVLKVLSGQGKADARGSQGNISEATFAWTFNPGPVPLAGNFVDVPSNAASFLLTISYPGGYTATATGNVSQVDLVPDFTPTQGTIFIGGSLTITNNMQKGTAVLLNSVDYSWDNGTTYAPVPSSFLAAGGTAAIAGPTQGTGYTLKLRYNYSKGGIFSSASVSHGPFNVSSDWVGSVTGPRTGTTSTTASFTATVLGGSGSPTFSWCWDACNLGGAIYSPGPATNSHRWTRAGTYVVYVAIRDSGITKLVQSDPVTITGSGQTGQVVVTLTGPTTGKPNQSLSFRATASGGSPPYSYSWCWNACNLGGSFTAGPATNNHTFPSTGTYSVTVRAVDSASRSAIKSVTVTISDGPVGGALAVSVGGPPSAEVGAVVSFTATATGGTPPYNYAWCFDACNLGGNFVSGSATITHSYTSSGSRAFVVRVTDSQSGSGTASAVINITGTGQTPPNPDYTVAGATLNDHGEYEGTAGTPITVSAAEENAASYAWDFGDQTTAEGRTATKSFADVGSFTVRLIVTGDGTNTFGTAGSAHTFVIKQPEYPCVPSPTALCLSRGRFQVSVAWHSNQLGTSGDGQAQLMTGDTGVFWFFAPTNLELMVKVLDGTSLNGYFWFFSGALSSVEYTITVTDTATNMVKTYHNDEPNFGSVADVSAFPADTSSTGTSASAWLVPEGTGQIASVQSTAAAEPCVAGSKTLCLNGNRFKVEVAFVGDPGGDGQTHPLTTDTGAFWFFQASNLELMVKVLDGRTINGHFWVFFGALSDVEYTISVTDTETGAVQTYHNPLHTNASAADLAAF